LHRRRLLSIAVTSSGLGCLALLSGCTDESKTGGTQVQLTPKDKAEIEDMRAAMKGHRVEVKQERIQDRKAKK
jgi:hypothetical protein